MTICDHREGAYSVMCLSNCFVINIINLRFAPIVRIDHRTVTAPLPVCSAKLSTVSPG